MREYAQTVCCPLHVPAHVSQVADALNVERAKQAETDTYIVERSIAALSVLKRCRTEEQRVEFHIVMSALAPERESARSYDGMIRRVAERLGLRRGARYVPHSKQKRAFAFERAIDRRAVFDSHGVAPRFGMIGPTRMGEPLTVGADAVSRGRDCKVMQIDYATNTCTLEFEMGGVKATKTYTSLDARRGGARLSRPPVLLRPQPRELRADEKMEHISQSVPYVGCTRYKDCACYLETDHASRGAPSPPQVWRSRAR